MKKLSALSAVLPWYTRRDVATALHADGPCATEVLSLLLYAIAKYIFKEQNLYISMALQ